MTKVIEIVGIGFPNKGAELMLYAIVDQLRSRFGEDVQICCQPSQSSRHSYRVLGNKNILIAGQVKFRRFSFGWAFNFLPKKLTDTFGIIRPKDVDIILDASGFRYSDSWGASLSIESYSRYRRFKKRGGKIIMLPQAFGPFTNKKVADAAKKIVACSDICFARDEISHQHLIDICGESPKISRAPDFTNLVETLPGVDRKQFEGKVIVIPNQRMLDKTDDATSERYYKHLYKVCTYLKKQGEELIILNHEGAPDQKICEQLSRDFNDLPIVNHWNPIYIKTVIGCCKLLISSRFHGCVSALSQGVPVIATSWNHKYEMLLKDYGIENNLINLKSDGINYKLIDDALHPNTREKIKQKTQLLKTKSNQMWDQVFKHLPTTGL